MNNRSIGNVVTLTGGSGGAKLVHGLAQIVPPEKLTIIVNTGDDFEHLNLHISPDLDQVMYTLAGIVNSTPDQSVTTKQNLKNESWNMMAAMARYSGPTWFQLGDRDLATHLLRSHWLHEGYPLSWITKELSRRLGVRYTILPMSDDRVQTMVQTSKGEVDLQGYLGQQPQPEAKKLEVGGIRYAGADEALPHREVINAVRDADVIIFGPSNPVLSLDPILAMPNLRRIITASRVPKIGVSGMVNGALAEPVASIMKVLGIEMSPAGVARHLREVLSGFVLDHTEQAYRDTLTKMGLHTLVTGTIMNSNEDRVRLAQEVLDFATGALPQSN